MGMSANLLLIVGHIKDPLKILQNSSSQFVLNIATVDLLVSFIMVTKTSLTLASPGYKLNMTVSNVIQTVSSAFISISFPAFLSLSVERFFSVAFPLWHRVRITSRVCHTWLGTLWFVNLSIEALITGLKFTPYKNTANLLHISYLGSSFLATQLFYSGTYLSLRHQRRRLIARQEINESRSRAIESRLQTEKRFLLTISIACLILALTLLPNVIYHHILSSLAKSHTKSHKQFINWPLMILLSINFAINPFIYLWRLPKYRRTFKILYCNS